MRCRAYVMNCAMFVQLKQHSHSIFLSVIAYTPVSENPRQWRLRNNTIDDSNTLQCFTEWYIIY